MSNKPVHTICRGFMYTGGVLLVLGLVLLILGILTHKNLTLIAMGTGFIGIGAGTMIGVLFQFDHTGYEAKQHKQGSGFRLSSN